jgi:hypothetical protein
MHYHQQKPEQVADLKLQRTFSIPLLTAAISLLMIGCAKSKNADSSSNNKLTYEEGSQGWDLLFDGSDLSHYRLFGFPDAELDRWSIEGDTLNLSARAEGSTSKADLILTRESVGDFDFSFEWKMSKGGNGGIFYMVKDDNKYEKPWHTGLEMQLLDNAGHKEGLINTHRSGDLYDLIASKKDTTNPAEDWNHSRIVRKGNSVEQWMNGNLAVSFTIGSSEWNKLVADSKYAVWPEYGKIERGHIILQDHGDQIAFRNLKIRELN